MDFKFGESKFCISFFSLIHSNCHRSSSIFLIKLVKWEMKWCKFWSIKESQPLSWNKWNMEMAVAKPGLMPRGSWSLYFLQRFFWKLACSSGECNGARHILSFLPVLDPPGCCTPYFRQHGKKKKKRLILHTLTTEGETARSLHGPQPEPGGLQPSLRGLCGHGCVQRVSAWAWIKARYGWLWIGRVTLPLDLTPICDLCTRKNPFYSRYERNGISAATKQTKKTNVILRQEPSSS